MRPRPAALAAAVCLAAAPRPARAWSNQGHMATGAIAYDDLARTSPALVREVVRLMAAHPDRARFDAMLGGATGAARDRMLFELMARWPDDARGTAYDRPDWHYAVRVVAPIGRVLSFTTGRAADAFAENLAVARDPRAGDARRAVALCWLFHLAGDIHQPLNTGTWWSWRFPKSDRAGTLSYVRTAPGVAVKFHEFWGGAQDRAEPAGLAGEAAGADAIARDAEARLPRAGFGAALGAAGAFGAWRAESEALARARAYRDPVTGRAVALAAAPGDAQPLPAGYAAAARALALRRVALAGYRLADVARGVLEAHVDGPPAAP